MNIAAEIKMEKSLSDQYNRIRKETVRICHGLEPDDYSCQPALFASPAKWHLAHTTWFFEHFILREHYPRYKPFHPQYHFLFNSYYETAGEHLIRTKRGALTRPTINEIISYREYIDNHMLEFCKKIDKVEISRLVTTGLNHEQQHQELLWMDIKYLLGTNPLFPSYPVRPEQYSFSNNNHSGMITFPEGVYEVGHSGETFSFDNETPRHKTFIYEFSIHTGLVTNGEYLEFMEAGGYSNVELWHSDGWEWAKMNKVSSPLYWYRSGNEWWIYSFDGLRRLSEDEPVMHISQYEAFAFANWKEYRLPTEFEWEMAEKSIQHDWLWEHTSSAYLPYPGYRKPLGTLGEYNAKFMANQMVLRGASFATPVSHRRFSYRNFFSPDMQWQFAGIRLAK